MKKNCCPNKKCSCLCSDHFTDSDYQIRPGTINKLFKLIAVSSVFKGFQKHLYKSPPENSISKEVTYIFFFIYII